MNNLAEEKWNLEGWTKGLSTQDVPDDLEKIRISLRLLEIAHETKDLEIRGFALNILRHLLNPLMILREPA